ncbi:unnamed protein product, partial [Rotaria socialis]
MINKKLDGSVFIALREYYRNELFRILKESGVLNRSNLYELALGCVTEHGWIQGLNMIKTGTMKTNFDRLMEEILKTQKQIPVASQPPTNMIPNHKNKKQLYRLSRSCTPNPLSVHTLPVGVSVHMLRICVSVYTLPIWVFVYILPDWVSVHTLYNWVSVYTFPVW